MEPSAARYLAALVGLALLAGCGATPRVISPFPTGRLNQKENSSEQPGVPFKKSWHIDVALRTGGLKFAATEQKLDRRLDLPLKLDLLGAFHHPTTPIDRKSEFGLNTISFGFGQSETEHFAWNAYGGFGVGADRSHQSFLGSTLDVNFQYGVYYAGLTAEFYPWSMPADGRFGMTWAERFEHGRMYFVAGAEVGYVRAEVDGDLTFASATLYKDGHTTRDWIFALPVGVGWATPLNEKWSLQSVLDYRFHFYRPEEYNGWNLTTALRRRF